MPCCANSIYERSILTPSEDVLSRSISFAVIEPTSFTLYLARVIATFRRRYPPSRLNGPKFIYIISLLSLAYPILKMIVSRSSPWTFSRFFIKNGSSLSSIKNLSNLESCSRLWRIAASTAFCWASLNVTTPNERFGYLRKCSKTKSATFLASMILFFFPPRSYTPSLT